jgi:predicted metalloprotease with PDZ domain
MVGAGLSAPCVGFSGIAATDLPHGVDNAARPADPPPAADLPPAPDKPGAATDSHGASDGSDSELESRLEAARKQLEQAAHEVAELSTQLAKPLLDGFSFFPGDNPHSLIGVQLDPARGKDGARIREVSPGGPAAESGLQPGDAIVAINGHEVKGDRPAREVLHLMHDVAPDSKVKVRVLRDGKPRDFVITARRRPDFMQFPGPLPPVVPMTDPHFALRMFHAPLADMELATVSPQLGHYFGTEAGVLVVRAPKEAGFKLEDGDVILAIDGREPTSGSHATRILSSYQPGEKISIRLMRQHKTLNVETTLPDTPSGVRRPRVTRKDEAPT